MKTYIFILIMAWVGYKFYIFIAEHQNHKNIIRKRINSRPKASLKHFSKN